MTHSAKPRAQAAADSLRELVLHQRLIPGDRLPSEAELVEILGVGRSSVREGVQLLESLGIVKVEHGRGMFLAPNPGEGLQRVINWVYPFRDRTPLIYDLLEARMIFEPAQCRLAAERATDEELDELLDIEVSTSHSAKKELTARQTERIGLGYHEKIARIAHNDILLIMSNAMRPLFVSLLEGIQRTRSEIAGLLAHHATITKAIVEREPDRAAEAMLEHLAANRSMLERWVARAALDEEGRRTE